MFSDWIADENINNLFITYITFRDSNFGTTGSNAGTVYQILIKQSDVILNFLGSVYELWTCSFLLNEFLKEISFFAQCVEQEKALWDNLFKNGERKVCGRQPIKNLKWYDLPKETISLKIF